MGLVLWEPPFYFSGESGKLDPALRKTPPMGTVSKASGKVIATWTTWQSNWAVPC